MEVGKTFDLKLAGSYAMDSLRLEKGYRHWSHEMDSETSPLEARLMYAVDLKKVIVTIVNNYKSTAVPRTEHSQVYPCYLICMYMVVLENYDFSHSNYAVSACCKLQLHVYS